MIKDSKKYFLLALVSCVILGFAVYKYQSIQDLKIAQAIQLERAAERKAEEREAQAVKLRIDTATNSYKRDMKLALAPVLDINEEWEFVKGIPYKQFSGEEPIEVFEGFFEVNEGAQEAFNNKRRMSQVMSNGNWARTHARSMEQIWFAFKAFGPNNTVELNYRFLYRQDCKVGVNLKLVLPNQNLSQPTCVQGIKGTYLLVSETREEQQPTSRRPIGSSINAGYARFEWEIDEYTLQQLILKKSLRDAD